MVNRREFFGAVLAIAGLIWIALMTLAPWHFRFHSIGLREYLESFEHWPSSPLDFPKNMLLFLPLGFGTLLWLEQALRSARGKMAVLAVIGFVCSLLVESLQIFDAGRTPNVADLLSNTLGAVCALPVLELIRRPKRALSWVVQRLESSNLSAVAPIYLTVLLILTWLLMRGLQPSGWEANYHLALGNEMTRDWPWEGALRDLLLMDVGLDEGALRRLVESADVPASGLIAGFYPLTAAEGTGSAPGYMPPLEWVGEPQLGTDGARLSEKSWLRTAAPASRFAEKVNRSREFTVAFSARAASVEPMKYPRIITFSANDEHTNFMLSQGGDDLEFRWRAPIAGEGTTPQFYFHDVFTTTNNFRAGLAFKKNTVRFSASNGARYVVFLGPEIGLEALFRDTAQWLVHISPRSFWFSKLLFCLIAYVPGGVLAGVQFLSGKRSKRFYGWLAAMAAAPLFVEVFVALYGQHPPRFGMMVCGFLTFVAAAAVARKILLLRRPLLS